MNSRYPVAILAGGLATRLRPLTETIPKSLILIQGEPFIFHQLRLLKKQGIERVVICVGYLGDHIEKKVGYGDNFGLQIQYSYDGSTLLGTGGALKKALPLLADDFFVLYGDSYLPCDFETIQTAYQRQKQQNPPKRALMTVYPNQGAWDASNVEYREGAIVQYDKQNRNASMQHIDYGLGIFNQWVFSSISDTQPTDLATIYQDLLQQQQLAAYEVSVRFYEVGSSQGIQEFTHYIRSASFAHASFNASS